MISDVIRLDERRSADQRVLWYAREGALVTLAAELVALTGFDVGEAVRAGYDRLEEESRKRGLETVARAFERYRRGRGHRDAWLEGLFSVMCCMNVSVLDLLLASVRGPGKEAMPSAGLPLGRRDGTAYCSSAKS